MEFNMNFLFIIKEIKINYFNKLRKKDPVQRTIISKMYNFLKRNM